MIPLNVSGAFHTPFMAEAAKEFGEFLAEKQSAVPAIPVYANETAEPYSDAPTKSLASQVNHPVRWEQSIPRHGSGGGRHLHRGGRRQHPAEIGDKDPARRKNLRRGDP